MDIEIRFATLDDFDLVRQFDPHSKFINPVRIRYKLSAQEIILAFESEKPVGIIKFSYFWATRPYLDLIWVNDELRGLGIGSQLLHFFEAFLIEQGHTHLLTSSQENEPEPQTWHKKHGFYEIGTLSDINLPYENTKEIFFIKRIAQGDIESDSLKEYSIGPET